VSQFNKPVIPGEPNDFGRDPWFDKLTTLSKVDEESRKEPENQNILDPGSRSAQRNLAGMTNYDTGSQGRGIREVF
jgi:hypothetical protein